MPTPGVRLLAIYVSEAARLLELGFAADRIDEAMEEFGFVMGPFRRIDAIGSRRVGRMLDAVAPVLGERVALGPIFNRLTKEGGTFYRYRSGRPSGLNGALPKSAAVPDESRGEVALGIRRRILLLLINEAARIVADDCVGDAADLEAVAILGLGFPREYGGLLYYAQTTGLSAIVADLRGAAEEFGRHFTPSPLLLALAASDRGFFRTPDADAGHHSTGMLE